MNGESLIATDSLISPSTTSADSAIRASAADAVNCEILDKSFPCIITSCLIVRDWRVRGNSFSFIINDSRG